MIDKQYLGDAVYVDVDQWGCLILTTEDGISVTNRIVLEPTVLTAMEKYIEQRRSRHAKKD